jgi:phosphohistidine phosphatase
MTLYLVQHGKSMSKADDPEQRLADAGIAETRQIAQVAAGYQVKVKGIRHSGKARALQTAEIFAKALLPADGVRQIEGIKPMDDVTAFASKLSPEEDLMVVGHLPFMSRLTAHLTCGRIEPPVFKFQNSGIVCLDRLPEDQHWLIVWTLMPNIG